jgi:hypothetical protein
MSVLPRDRGHASRWGAARTVHGACTELGRAVMFMNCLVENAAMMHLARKQDLKIAVSGAELKHSCVCGGLAMISSR